MRQNAYQTDFATLMDELQSSEIWLSDNVAKLRYEKYWPNAIQSKDKNSAIKISL